MWRRRCVGRCCQEVLVGPVIGRGMGQEDMGLVGKQVLGLNITQVRPEWEMGLLIILLDRCKVKRVLHHLTRVGMGMQTPARPNQGVTKEGDMEENATVASSTCRILS